MNPENRPDTEYTPYTPPTGPGPTGPAPTGYTAYKPQETPEQKKERAALFAKIIGPTLLYALLFTLFIYNNFSGITMPLFALTTVAYSFYCFKIFDIELKKGSYLYGAFIVLLGVSSFLTGSIPIIVLNCFAMVFMILCMLLHNFFNDDRWDLGKYVSAIIQAVAGAILEIFSPFQDAANFDRHKEKKTKSFYVLIGLAIAFPLLVIIIALLYNADAVFASFVRKIFQDISFATVVGVLFTFAFAFMAAYCGIRYLGKRKIKEDIVDRRRFEPIIAVTALILISIVYLIFSLIQIVYLFIGNMKLPEGYTYASYAHEGFFQLLFVCILNVIIVLFTLKFFRKRMILNILLTVISLCTYIMIASSALRMWLYVQVYSLSVLRVFVFWGLAVLAVLFVGILIQIYKDNFHLFGFGLAVICIFYLSLSFGHMDYWIAKFNLGFVAAANGSVDYDYLSGLSSDAAPVIAEQEGVWVDVYAQKQLKYAHEGIRKFNVSHNKAIKVFSEFVQAHENDLMVVIDRFNFSDSGASDVSAEYSLDNVVAIDCVYKNADHPDKTGSSPAKIVDNTAKNTKEFIAYIPRDFFKDSSEGIDLSVNITFSNNITLNSDHTYVSRLNEKQILGLILERYDHNLYLYSY